LKPKVDLVVEDVKRLHRVEGAGEFVVGVYRLLHRIDRDPDLSAVIQRESDAAVERRAAFQFHDNAAVGELVALRKDFAEAMPEIPGAADLDDSSMDKPDIASHERLAYDFSLANFDEIAGRSREVKFASGRGDTTDPSRTSTLLDILVGKNRELREAADKAGEDEARKAVLGDLSRRLGNIVRQHEHAYHRFLIDSWTLPGLAFGRLGLVVNALNPEPIIVESKEDEDRVAEAVFGMVLSAGWTAQKTVFGGRVGDVSESERKLMVNEMRENLDLVVEALQWAATEAPDGGPAPSVQIDNSVITALAVGSGPVRQDVSQERVTVENYWGPLSAELSRLGVPNEDVEALRTALEEDAKGVDPDGPGGATRRWLTSLGRKVADGALAVAVDVVAAVIRRHAGLGP
jgi:hypothetical protein